METSLTTAQKLLVLKILNVPCPPKPSRSSIATSVNPMPTDKNLANALAEWEKAVDRLHVIMA